jgi:hypothetical protein
MRLEGRSRQLRAQLRKAGRSASVARGASERLRMYDMLHSACQTGATPSETSPQPPSFRQRIAAAQERDECLCVLLPNSLPIFATMRGC